MNKYIFLITLFAFAVTSCTDEGMEFDTNGGNGLEFIHFVGSSRTLAAKADANAVDIVVSASSLSNQERTYKLIIDESSTAIKGTHYTLSSETVTIPANQYSGTVTLSANTDNLTPETVVVDLIIDSDEAIDYNKKLSISMYLFFEVSIDWLVGTWTWTDYVGSDVDDVYDVEIVRVDDNTISITNIWAAEETVTATVNYDDATIAIEPNSVIYHYATYGDVYMNAVQGTAYSKTSPIIGTCYYNGTISIASWGAYVHDYSEGAYFAIYTSALSNKR
jgi:hypothetical protein